MFKISPTVLAATLALTLSACGAAAPSAPAADQPSFSSSSLSSVMPTGSGDAVIDMLHAWTPELAWSDVEQTTNDDMITIDATHAIDAHKMQGKMVKANISAAQYQKFMTGVSRDSLTAMASSSGWGAHLQFDADGATGTQWGYMKSDAAGQRFLIVSAHGTDCTNDANVPPVCTQYQAKAYLSDTLGAGDDM